MYNALKEDRLALEKIPFMKEKTLRDYVTYRNDINNNIMPPRVKPKWGAAVWLVGRSDLKNRHHVFEKQIKAWNTANPDNQILLPDTTEFDAKQEGLNKVSDEISSTLGINLKNRYPSENGNKLIAFLFGNTPFSENLNSALTGGVV